jgi:rod shape-determining protein MreC
MSKPGLTLSIGPRTRRVFLALLILVTVTIFLLPRQTQKLLGNLGNPLTQLVAVPLEGFTAMDGGVRGFWNHYIALQGVYEQNLALKEDIERLKEQLTQLREQVIISEQLTQLLSFQQAGPIQMVAARVIGRNATNWYRTLILDKGGREGIKPNMGVITHAGVVGRVVKTHPSTAIVLLLTDPNVAVPAMIQGTREEGIVQGTTQGYIRLKYLPPLSPVQIGENVVTSGLTGAFPRGLQIGQISRLRKADTDLFRSAEIQSSVEFQKLEGVLVITSPGPLTHSGAPPEEFSLKDQPTP